MSITMPLMLTFDLSKLEQVEEELEGFLF